MASFIYTARDTSGRAQSGTLEAATMADALQQLRAEGKFPISVRPAQQTSPGGGAAPAATVVGRAGVRISRADVIQMSTQLAIMIETGVVLSEALDCIARQAEKPNVKELVTDLVEQLQAGISLSEALSRHPRSFPRLFVALIRASEKSGMMSRLLNRAVAYLRDERETIRRVKGALTYPAIMLLFAVTTTTFLLAFVLPRFAAIYSNKRAALPVPTQILMGLSERVVAHWPMILGGVGSASFLLFIYLRTPQGMRLWHSIQLRLPLLGKIYRKLHLSRSMRMVGTMAAAGVQLLDSVNTAHDLSSNVHYRELWKKVADQIQVGRQLSEPMFQSPLVPRAISQMLASGEKSGRLAQVMEQVAAYSEEELKEQVANMTRYIEPLMIITMGLIIGGVAMALLLPVFSLSKIMAH